MCRCAASSGAQHVYVCMFVAVAACTWLLRDLAGNLPASSVSSLLPACGNGNGNACIRKGAVMRLSFGSFCFFLLLSVITLGIRDKRSGRAWLHNHGWLLTAPLYVGLLLLPFLLPGPRFDAVLGVYGELARFGSALFLLLQLLSLLQAVYDVNEALLMRTEASLLARLALALGALLGYGGGSVAVAFLYRLFAPEGGCSLHIGLITGTLGLALLYTVISLHPQSPGGLFTSGAIYAYSSWLAWAALNSSGPSACNRLLAAPSTGVTDWTQVVGFVLALAAVVIGTQQLGLDTKPLELGQAASSDAAEPPLYNYSFFHAVFALGSMYLAMLFTGWSLEDTQGQWALDTGWRSMWVKIATQWATDLLYLWTLVAPLLLKQRRFS